MNNPITKLAARLLDRLKMSNPVVFFVVQGVLMSLHYVFLESGLPDSIGNPGWVNWVIYVIQILMGSRTTRFLKR